NEDVSGGIERLHVRCRCKRNDALGQVTGSSLVLAAYCRPHERLLAAVPKTGNGAEKNVTALAMPIPTEMKHNCGVERQPEPFPRLPSLVGCCKRESIRIDRVGQEMNLRGRGASSDQPVPEVR